MVHACREQVRASPCGLAYIDEPNHRSCPVARTSVACAAFVWFARLGNTTCMHVEWLRPGPQSNPPCTSAFRATQSPAWFLMGWQVERVRPGPQPGPRAPGAVRLPGRRGRRRGAVRLPHEGHPAGAQCSGPCASQIRGLDCAPCRVCSVGFSKPSSSVLALHDAPAQGGVKDVQHFTP